MYSRADPTTEPEEASATCSCPTGPREAAEAVVSGPCAAHALDALMCRSLFSPIVSVPQMTETSRSLSEVVYN